MTDHGPTNGRSANEGQSRSTTDDTVQTTTGLTASRRRFLRSTAGAGALAMGATAGFSGTASAVIPTPRLHRDGNLLKDPAGNKVVLHGVNVVDARRADEKAPHYKLSITRYIEMATNADDGWHAQVIRLPLQPQDIGGHDYGSAAPAPGFTESELETYLEDHIDAAVETAREQGTYIMIDYHRHYESGPEWTDPELDEEIRLFWNTVAPRYADEPHVIYELYNEPTLPYAGDDLGPNESIDVISDEGEQTWLDWRETAQPWVDLVREHAPETLIVIGSPRWSQWTYWAAEHEFEGENLAYSGHVYTQEGIRPLSKYFGEPSEEVPVFISEWGFEEDGGPNYLVGSADEEGQAFIDFFEEYDTIHTQAWCFDFNWEPAMLDRDYEIDTEWGQLVQDFLAEKRDEDVPQVSAGDGNGDGNGNGDGDGDGDGNGDGDGDGDGNGDGGGNGDGDGNEEDTIEVGDYNVADSTDDGLYNDFDGDGETTHDDVSAFFETLEDDAVQNNPDAFDFDDNGRIGFSDVIDLLRRV